MDIKVDDMFSLSSGRYITLDEKVYEQERYIFTNKLDGNENPTQEFVVFKCLPEGLSEDINSQTLKILLEYFSEQANEKLAMVNNLIAGKGE